jgi:FkbM family methyltransferase
VTFLVVQVVTEQVGKRDSLEQVVDGMHQEIRALKSELKSELKPGRLATPKVPPLNLYMGNSIVMCWIDFFHTYFFLDSRDRGVTPHLCQGSVWERKITEAVEKVVLPGQNVVDVGASIGWYTAAFMRAVGPTGRVLSIEANPRLSDLLGRTVQSNPNVKIMNKAVGNEDDKKVFIENDMSWSPGNKVVDKANNAVQVDYIKLDTLLQDEAWHQVDVIKVDVEGHESQVWKGMQDILNDNPNVALILEVSLLHMLGSVSLDK